MPADRAHMHIVWDNRPVLLGELRGIRDEGVPASQKKAGNLPSQGGTGQVWQQKGTPATVVETQQYSGVQRLKRVSVSRGWDVKQRLK